MGHWPSVSQRNTSEALSKSWQFADFETLLPQQTCRSLPQLRVSRWKREESVDLPED